MTVAIAVQGFVCALDSDLARHVATGGTSAFLICAVEPAPATA